MSTQERHRLQGPVASQLAAAETSSSLTLYQRDQTVRAYVEHFRARVVQDALAEASAAYWLRRADAFDAARPRSGDYHGNATREALRARYKQLSEMAAACRAAAEVALIRDGALS